ncbi:hypothetical protein [Ectopseudomonas oleovorans]|uniref:Uncharacterized protein n=1 Tax=Ectopseudomonas oleovorans TaxID=301 RepID=A0AA42QDP4_ECTOL|nr:hypothetical protein [Pseudomonas oleovorans]MDH1341857.1 hypothetical protein [Pseudomonas oleovorans]MDH1490853.1 hypothetical protein [Pseudomonas oleovorans]WGG23333.1 hypothetical protein N5O83_14305 [Pseudomonas oleovorans]
MSMSQSHAVKLINAQAAGITLARAVELLDEARRFVGQSSSVRAMDLSQEIIAFTARYRQTFDSDDSPQT